MTEHRLRKEPGNRETRVNLVILYIETDQWRKAENEIQNFRSFGVSERQRSALETRLQRAREKEHPGDEKHDEKKPG
jgi:hypothetical protein